ncbi:hypothetical protein [Nostoc commune]|uniref:hypothetical protein n=1 Tax=Nostoc commune TaxID=1178 RepID=UPI0011B27F93|nr:hypothetical protein [Nostoc commune]
MARSSAAGIEFLISLQTISPTYFSLSSILKLVELHQQPTPVQWKSEYNNLYKDSSNDVSNQKG